MNRSTSDHAFFDETSLYMRLRARFLPEEKLRGYFQWVREQREQAAAGALLRELVAAGSSVVVRLDAPDRPVRHRLTLPEGTTLGACFRAEVHPPPGRPLPLAARQPGRARHPAPLLA